MSLGCVDKAKTVAGIKAKAMPFGMQLSVATKSGNLYDTGLPNCQLVFMRSSHKFVFQQQDNLIKM